VYGSSVEGTAHTEPTHSSALPPPKHTHTTALGARIHHDLVVGSPKVIVLDTGLAAQQFRPGMLGSGIAAASATDIDSPDEDDDEYLDPTAGHGTFIAGVIAQIAPGCDISVHRVLSTFGDGDEWKISHRIRHLAIADPERTILSLSFGGYVLENPHLMARTIRRIQRLGVHVVASAGNDATSRPTFPACLPGVVAVGALGPNGPAWFTNYGEWVDACAPGSDLLSSFFVFDGPAEEGPYGDDPDDFDGWAQWSGTSFAAPVVVGNLVRLMMAEGIATRGAIRRIIDTTALFRIPGLGTVVDAL
jgi:subtilisin family serine protease